jgi:transglycosylase-like protein with SLT domain
LIAGFREVVVRHGFARARPCEGCRRAPGQPLSPGGRGQASSFLPILLLSTTLAVTGSPARALDVGVDPTAVQPQPSSQPDENHRAGQIDGHEPTALSTVQNPCEALAAAATANDLPVDFFTRLIWQESRFRPDAVSPKGAQGIAQFMPATARSSGLENPFDPLESIAKSGALLRALRDEFGNLGLAAAAYNAGSERVHGWLGGRRTLPQETRTYVRLVTGRSAEEWAAGQVNPTETSPSQASPSQASPGPTAPVEMPALEVVRCNLPGFTSIGPWLDASKRKPAVIKPWGVEVVGAPTPAKALARYREWRPKYAAIIAQREPHVVIRGIVGQMAAARVRVGEDSQVAARKLCTALRAAGAYCDVMRN